MGETRDREKNIAGLDAIAVVYTEENVEIIVAAHRHEHRSSNRNTGGDSGPPGNEVKCCALVWRHRGHRRHVNSAIEILLDRSEHQ